MTNFLAILTQACHAVSCKGSADTFDGETICYQVFISSVVVGSSNVEVTGGATCFQTRLAAV
jgi:hypothetical protein